MTAISPPPIGAAIGSQTPNGKFEVELPWATFFNDIYEGDAGESWEPQWTNLTEVGGSAEITARIARVNQNVALWDITIDPATSVSATAGSTYAEGFPLQFLRDSFCIAVSGGLGALPGHVVASNQRIYIPALSAVTVPVTICGIGFAR